MPKLVNDPAVYIEPLNMNGLQGRMMYVPAPKGVDREILVVYGHHALLERWWGLIQNFNTYGGVTMPDLPGFGGMDSFYKIGQKPTLDNMADYMASFIKMRYKRKRVTIVGISYGFLIVTRMLQRYPELTKRVDMLVSAIGFSHHDDFMFSKRRLLWYRSFSLAMSIPPCPWLFRYIALNPWVLRKAYKQTHNAKKKFAASIGSPEKFNATMDMEIDLWQSNDVRTYMSTTREFLNVDNCRQKVDLPVWHIGTTGDYYFDSTVVEQHMRIIFKDFVGYSLDLKSHAPSVIANKREAATFIPLKLRRVLAEKK
ncbi:MAG TPA: alpha/beta hydrolase [Patescibacteria group bacterium]|nr:alpha/beta hydrolase [Patescibacteria group bacterium]